MVVEPVGTAADEVLGDLKLEVGTAVAEIRVGLYALAPVGR